MSVGIVVVVVVVFSSVLPFGMCLVFVFRFGHIWLCLIRHLINGVWSMVLMAFGIVNHLHLTSVRHSLFCLNLLKLFRNISN